MLRYAKANNERSEAIELIKFMDSIVKRNTWKIKSIGGESTLNTGKKRMFPDVFVYGDKARTQVLQGWEVKMPDVPITDSALIADAWRKADVLGVNSCVIWNFSHGVLYIKDADGWAKAREWNEAEHICTRTDVATHRSDWESVVSDVLEVINEYFISDRLRPSRIGEITTDTVMAEIIERNKAVTAEFVQEECVKNTAIASYVSHWWRSVEKEYRFDENNKFFAYAKFILTNWLNKITFAHLIKGSHNPASAIEEIREDTTPLGALNIFDEITASCDFFNVFEAVPCCELLPRPTWLDLTDYNAFLSENGLARIPQAALQSVLENSVTQFKRSISGIFATPQKLAEILVKAGIANLAAPAIDPCCGTGTIAKEILGAKESAIGIEAAFSSTFASDKFSFPLQIANIAMTRAAAMNLPSLLFRSNAFDLREGKEVEITDPQNGERTIYRLPKWGSVISNLPFVAFDQEGREESRRIEAVLRRVRAETGIRLSGRADLYQGMLLHLHGLLDDGASVAAITSNSWLGTLAGQGFFRALSWHYDVECVIGSGHGKWFDNADVVAVMVFMKKKSAIGPPPIGQYIHFGLINKPMSEITAEDTAKIVDSIKLKLELFPELLSFRTYDRRWINEFPRMNIAFNSLFYDIYWLSFPEIKEKLCPPSLICSMCSAE